MRPISAWLGCNNSEVFPVLCRTRAMRFPLLECFLCVRMSGDYRVRADLPIIGRDPWEMFDKFISIGMLKAEEYG